MVGVVGSSPIVPTKILSAGFQELADFPYAHGKRIIRPETYSRKILRIRVICRLFQHFPKEFCSFKQGTVFLSNSNMSCCSLRLYRKEFQAELSTIDKRSFYAKKGAEASTYHGESVRG